PYDARTPLTEIARIGAEDKPTGPAFARARSDRELWVSSGRSARYDLNVERGGLAAAWTLNFAGPALAPIQVADRTAVLTQQSTEGPGVGLWGINPVSGAVVWRTTRGAAWPTVLLPSPDGERLGTLAADGRALTIDASRLAEGGFIEGPLPKPGTSLPLPVAPEGRLEFDGADLVIPRANSDQLLVRERGR